MKKIRKFDQISPPELSVNDNKTILIFKKLPPSNKPHNPLYKRLEVIINNTIGYQHRIVKSSDFLRYEIESTNSQDVTKIYNTFENFHQTAQFIRFNGNKNFMTSKEASSIIRDHLLVHLKGFQIKSKSMMKISLIKGQFKLTIQWSFLRGDASKELSFSWYLSSESVTNLHNELNTELNKPKSKELWIYSIRQEYDNDELRKLYSGYFDVANHQEVIQSTEKFIKYLEDAILNKFRNTLTLSDIATKHESITTKRMEYVKSLILSLTDPSLALEKLKTSIIQHESETENISLLKRKLKSL